MATHKMHPMTKQSVLIIALGTLAIACGSAAQDYDRVHQRQQEEPVQSVSVDFLFVLYPRYLRVLKKRMCALNPIISSELL